jgi:endonuclease IV
MHFLYSETAHCFKTNEVFLGVHRLVPHRGSYRSREDRKNGLLRNIFISVTIIYRKGKNNKMISYSASALQITKIIKNLSQLDWHIFETAEIENRVITNAGHFPAFLTKLQFTSFFQ